MHVLTGDTSAFHWGTGTFASRGAVVAGSACHAAATLVREKALALAAEHLKVDRTCLVLAGGAVRVADDPARSIALGDLARRANPLRGAVRPGTEPGLEATAYFGPDRGSTASGVHAMQVEVDPETAMVKILRYVVVHDCGRVINPLIVEGQIQGGVAHGIGNAFFEQLRYDESGQLLNASFMDYLLPTASEVPAVEISHAETPSPLNPLGVKGVGEAGCIPTGAAFAQAVEDALGDPALEILEIPLSPSRLFELIQPEPRKHTKHPHRLGSAVYPATPTARMLFVSYSPWWIVGAWRHDEARCVRLSPARHRWTRRSRSSPSSGPMPRPLAGGQSLVPAMNFRLARPGVLVDLNALASLALHRGDGGRRAPDRRDDPPARRRAKPGGGDGGRRSSRRRCRGSRTRRSGTAAPSAEASPTPIPRPSCRR